MGTCGFEEVLLGYDLRLQFPADPSLGPLLVSLDDCDSRSVFAFRQETGFESVGFDTRS